MLARRLPNGASVDSLPRHIPAILMQDDGCCGTGCVRDERELGVDDLEKEILIPFREDFELRLCRCLSEQAIPFAGDRQDEIWRELVPAHVAIEQLRIDGDLGVWLRRLNQWNLRVEEMQSNVVDASRRFSIREYDHADLHLGIVP